MAKKKQETLVLFPELVAITRKFTDEQFGILIRAAFAYRFTGEMYEGEDLAIEVAFQTVANQLDRYKELCDSLSQNARGQKPPQPAAEEEDIPQEEAEEDEVQQEEAEGSKMQQNPPPIQSNPIQSNPIQSREETADEPPHPPTKKACKHQYGEYKNVLLTDDELARLRTELSNSQELIERLSEYIASSGKKYKSHYATLRSWARREPKTSKPPQVYPEDDLTGIL